MEESGIKLRLEDAWVDGGPTEAVAVEISELSAGNAFSLTPQDDEDRRRIAARLGVCRKCGGQGFLFAPYGKDMRTAQCPGCRGKSKSMDDPEVRLAILDDCCHGWTGWTTASGRAIEYGESIRRRIAADGAVFTAVVAAASTLKKTYAEAEAKNSESGPSTSSGEPAGRPTSGPVSVASSTPGD